MPSPSRPIVAWVTAIARITPDAPGHPHLLVYFLFVGLSGYFLLSTVREQIRPVVRQSSEETLVDTANLLAEILHDDVKAGTLSQSRLPQVLASYGERRQARRSGAGEEPDQPPHLCHRRPRDRAAGLQRPGRGQGLLSLERCLPHPARPVWRAPTRSDPADETTSVMHVAAPILDQGRIIGVVTVAKPNSSLQPYIDRAEQRLLNLGLGLIGLGLLVGAALSWWLARSLRRLTRYAQAVSEGQRAALPHYKGASWGSWPQR